MVFAVQAVQVAARMAASLIVPGFAPHSVANAGIQRGTNPNKIGNRVLRAPWIGLLFSIIAVSSFSGVGLKFFGFVWGVLVCR